MSETGRQKDSRVYMQRQEVTLADSAWHFLLVLLLLMSPNFNTKPTNQHKRPRPCSFHSSRFYQTLNTVLHTSVIL